MKGIKRVAVGLLGLLSACTRVADSPLKVGTNPWAGSEPLYLARELGLYPAPQPVHLVEFTSARQLARAFRNGVIDAAAVPLIEVLRFEHLGQHPRVVLVLDDSSQPPGERVDVVIVREEYLATHPGQVDSLLEGWFAALEHYRNHPEQDARRMAPRLGLDEERFQKALLGIRLADENEQRVRLMGSEPRLRASVEQLGAAMLRAQSLSVPPDAAGLLDPVPLSRILSRREQP